MKVPKLLTWFVVICLAVIILTSCQSDVNSTNQLEQADVSMPTEELEPTKEPLPEPTETPLPTDTPVPTDIPITEIKNIKFRGNPQYLWRAGFGYARSSTFSPDGSRLAIGGSSNIRILDMKSFGIAFESQTDQIEGIVWIPEGNVMISASSDGSVIFWDTESNTQSALLETEPVYSLDISPDGSEFVIGQESGNIQFVSVTSMEITRSIVTDTGSTVKSLSWSPDGSLVACGEEGGDVQIVDSNSRDIIHTITQDETTANSTNSLEWSPDGKILATGHQNGQVLLWDTTNWELIKTIELNEGSVWDLVWVPNSTGLTICGEGIGITLWDIDSEEFNNNITDKAFVSSCAWSPNGKYLALAELYVSEEGEVDLTLWIYIRSD